MENKESITNEEVLMKEAIENQISLREQEDAYFAIVDEDIIANQISISEQEEERAALEAKYSSVEVSEAMTEFDSESVVEYEEGDVEENNIEVDGYDDWGSVDDNPYYDDNLDMDQQSPEFWDNL